VTGFWIAPCMARGAVRPMATSPSGMGVPLHALSKYLPIHP
jgi:hypothetical protein